MYKKASKNPLRIIEFSILDLLFLQIAFVLAFTLRHGAVNPYGIGLYRNMALFITLADIVSVYILSTYEDVLYRNRYDELRSTVKHTILLVLLSVLYLFSMQYAQDYSRIAFFIMFAIYFITVYFAKLILKKFLRNNIREIDRCSLLLIVTKAEAEQNIINIQSDVAKTYSIHGIVILDGDESMVGQELFGVKIVTDLNSVPQYVAKNIVDEVLIVQTPDCQMPSDILSTLSKTGVVIHINIGFPEKMYGNTRLIETIANKYTVTTICMKSASDLDILIKRMTDIAGGLIGCIVTGILCIFLAPAIKLSSPGPLFFAQERVGKNGRIFKMYKFRSMVPNAEELKNTLESDNKFENGLMFKMDFDPRIIGNKILPDGTHKTGIGEFIRKTSIDEFPQFFNVLTGSMSLVGTRPPTVDEYKKYSLSHKARIAVKPGITGWWQVSGRSEITDFEKVVALDTEYINNWTLGFDAKILIKTLKVIIKHDGAM